MPDHNWTLEINLFECFNKTLADVKPWLKQLKEDGVEDGHGRVHPVCPYDVQNLEYSALFILGSLTTKFRSEIEHSVGSLIAMVHPACCRELRQNDL